MPVTAICPQCQATYKLAEAFFGKQVRCKKCQKVFPVGKAPAKVPAGKKAVAKKTMLADDEAIREESPRAPRAGAPVAPVVKKNTKASPPPPEKVVPPGKKRPPSDEDEGIVETTAAAPRRNPLPPARPAGPPPREEARRGPGRYDDDEEPPRRGRRPAEDDDDYDDDLPRRPEGRRAARGRDDYDRDDPDDDREMDDDEAAPRKSRKGLLIGLIAGGVVLAGGALALLLVMRGGGGGGPAGKDGELLDSPEVTLNLERLEQDRERHLAVEFFAAFPEPTKEKKRDAVAQTLETVVRNRIGGLVRDDQLIHAYCRWAPEDRLIEALKWDTWWMDPHNNRRRIIDTIAGFKTDSGADALLKHAENHHPDRHLAFNALATMGGAGGKKLATLVFTSPDHGIRWAARDALKKADPNALIDAAILGLDSKDDGIRREALGALNDIKAPAGDKAKAACEKLLAIIDEDDPFGRIPDALPNFVVKDTVPLVAKYLKGASPKVNGERLITALWPYKDQPEVAEAIAQRVQSNHHGERRKVMDLAEALAPTTGGKSLLAHLNNPDHGMRERARNGIFKYGVNKEDQLEQCVKDLGSENRDIRYNAAKFLSDNAPVPKLRPAADKALALLAYEDDVFRRDHIFDAMAVWYGVESYKVLYKILSDSPNRDLRHRAITCMGKIRDKNFVPYIAYRLKSTEDRFHAGRILREMGSAAEPGLWPYVQDMKDRELRDQAFSVLESIATSASLPYLQKAGIAAANIGDNVYQARVVNLMKRSASK